MKKTICALMIAVSAIALATAADATNMAFKPYVGVDYTHVRANATQLRPYFNAGAINLGVNYNKYFGTELFYQKSDEWAHRNGDDPRGKISEQAYGLDLMGYLPLGCSKFSLVGTVGIGSYEVAGKQKPWMGTHKDTGLGYRFGAGLMYNVTNNVAVRGMFRYIEFDKVQDVDHALEYSLGVRYTF